MPRAKKQTGTTAAPPAGMTPPPPVPGVGGPPPMPPGGFNPGMAPPPPAPPQGFPGAPQPPAPPNLGQLAHPVPGANVAPPNLPAPGAFTPLAPQPMVPPQSLPQAPPPVAQGGADLGPVLAKLEDLGASTTKALNGLDGKIQQAVAAGLQPIGTQVKELFDLMQALYNMMMNNGPSQEQAAAHQQQEQQAAPPATQPAGPAGGLDKATQDQLLGSLRQYKGYDAGQLAHHFAQSYQSQGFPQLTAEVIYGVAHQAGLIGADGKLQ